MHRIEDPDFPHLLYAKVEVDDGFLRIGPTYRFDAAEFRRVLSTIDASRKKRFVLTHYFAPEDALRIGRMSSSVDFDYEPEHSAPLKIGMSYFTPPMIEELKAWLDTQI